MSTLTTNEHPQQSPAVELALAAAPREVLVEALRRSMAEASELRALLLRWQGAMRFSGVAAIAENEPDANPVAQLIRDTDAML